MIGSTSFFAERRDYAERIAIFARVKQGEKYFYPKPTVWEEQGGGLSVDEPLLILATEDAQRLIDELWQAGLRPTQGKQSEGVMSAQASHLEDMRALAFAKLNVTKP
jgi:hypothetical protein